VGTTGGETRRFSFRRCNVRKVVDELTAADVMRGGVVAIPAVLSLRDAPRVMADAGACAAPVTDDRGRCVGLLHASDVLRWVADGGATRPEPVGLWSEWQVAAPGAGEVGRRMSLLPPAVSPDAPLREVARLLLARRTAAVVVDGRHRPVGVISPPDLLAVVTADPLEVNARPGHPGPARSSAKAV
jgi:CBS domain-containing protein